MSPQRLVEMVEKNWESIADRVIERVHTDPQVPNYRALTDHELRYRARDLLSQLGHWLSRRDEARLTQRYEALGRRRFDEGMPLHEVIYKLQLLKQGVLAHARDYHLELSAIQLYAEQEFLGSVDEFFDLIIFSVCKGHSERSLSVKTAKASPVDAVARKRVAA